MIRRRRVFEECEKAPRVAATRGGTRETSERCREMLWSRKPAPVHDRSRAVGIDLTASRALAVALTSGKSRPVFLDTPHTELLLSIEGDRRTAAVGRAGYALCRKLPHLVCSNFLPALGQSREWRIARHTFTAESALGLVFEKLRTPVEAETEAVALSLPAYLGPAQVTRAV